MAVEVAIKTFKDVRITLSHCRFCYTKQKKRNFLEISECGPLGGPLILKSAIKELD